PPTSPTPMCCSARNRCRKGGANVRRIARGMFAARDGDGRKQGGRRERFVMRAAARLADF
ncbi:hypothetical protein, partial [Burkholderia sp. MSMB2041]|uniref:hypothetical protein n=1 Tax=Burkholderia sp. MSMB2041 TaxID=1637839 RepID=UPI001E2C07EE